MFDLDHWQEIFYSIKQNKLRTFLSGFTIALGLFIFIFLSGMVNGLQKGFLVEFIHDATNQITIFPGMASEAYKGLQENREITLENNDLDLVKKEYDKELEYKSAVITNNETVAYGTETGVYKVQGIYPDKKYIKKIKITSGRFITSSDMKAKNKYAIIGNLIEKDLFKKGNSLGKYISIGGINYKIIGTFTDKAGDRDERIIYIPLSTYQLSKNNSNKIDQIELTYNPETLPADAIELGKKIESDLKSKLNISPTDKTAIYIRNTADQMKDTFVFFTILTLLALFIGFGTIVSGVIGISNIMVYIVKERTKEIGVRKALGARPRDIISLILHESIFITTISGFIGVLLGVIGLNLIGDSFKSLSILDPHVNWELIVIATLALISFGAISGFIPAKKAAQIKPIEALHSD